jgi:hypothetical protein
MRWPQNSEGQELLMLKLKHLCWGLLPLTGTRPLGTNALSKHLKEVRELAACAAISSSTSSARSSLPVVDVNISYLPFFAKDPRKQENWIIDSMQSMRVSHFPCFSSNTHLTHCFVDRNLRKLQPTSLHIITCFLHRRQMLLYKIISRTIMQTNICNYVLRGSGLISSQKCVRIPSQMGAMAHGMR